MSDDLEQRRHRPVDASASEQQKAAATEINVQDFQAARQDPRIRDFLQNAKAYGKKLDREGRIHRD